MNFLLPRTLTAIALALAGPLAARLAAEPVVRWVPATGDAAFRLVTKSPFGAGRRLLVMGAATPAGFARLARFAVHNADHWAPESNRDDLVMK